MGSRQHSEVERGLIFYQNGDLTNAERLLKKGLRDQHQEADCRHLLGLIAFQRGKFDLAARQIRLAVAAQPDNSTFLCNLGAAQLESGATHDAIASYTRAIALRPKYPQALTNLGLAQARLGEYSRAETAHRQVIEIDPLDATAHFNLANSLIAQNRLEEGIEAFTTAIQRDENYGEARSNLASAYRARGDFAAALFQLGEAVRRDPDNFALRYNFADTCHQAGRLDVARENYAIAISLAPDAVEARINLAGVLVDLARPGEAIDQFRACCKIRPRDAALRGSLASLLEQVNLLSEASEHLNAGLKLAPDDEHLRLLAARFRRRDGDPSAARRQLTTLLAESLPPDIEAEAQLELGVVLDRLGEFSAAFAATARGQRVNAGLEGRRSYDLAAYRKNILANGRWFCRDHPLPAVTASADAKGDPIFFVGFPRSGTTLVEQILASHPNVFTSAEAGLLANTIERARGFENTSRPYPELMAQLSDDKLASLREHYWQQAARIEQANAGRWVDKLPLNIVHLGFIRWVFPRAKILVAIRDPRDVVISCFMQSFRPNAAMAHFSSIETTADLYTAVMELWFYYRDELGLDWMEYRYEDLVAEPETVIREIIEHLVLNWSDELLDHTKIARQRHIATPSYADVTQPMYARAIGRWQNYRAELEPILPKLEPYVSAFGYEPS